MLGVVFSEARPDGVVFKKIVVKRCLFYHLSVWQIFKFASEGSFVCTNYKLRPYPVPYFFGLASL